MAKESKKVVTEVTEEEAKVLQDQGVETTEEKPKKKINGKKIIKDVGKVVAGFAGGFGVAILTGMMMDKKAEKDSSDDYQHTPELEKLEFSSDTEE